MYTEAIPKNGRDINNPFDLLVTLNKSIIEKKTKVIQRNTIGASEPKTNSISAKVDGTL